MIIPEFLPFKPLPNAAIVAASLKGIPSHWSLTPLQGKKPFRKGWQSEPFIPHRKIAELILNGEEAISKEGKPYRRFWSGFGLRLGEASVGLLAVDVDGSSARPILEAMIGDIPATVAWTSGKAGRQQLLFQVPDNLRDSLKDFTRAVVTEWEGLKTSEGELLEFRYNRCQSALPPSFHPDTGDYKWLQSPNDSEVSALPPQLCEIILKLAEGEGQKEQAKSQSRCDREKAIQESAERRKALGIIGSSDLFDCFAQSVARLSPEEIFNWSGHNFKSKGGEWFGCCPQHQSASGESFTVKPEKLDWYCYGCGVGGGIGEYRHFINGGSGTPKGKDFFRITKELAKQARVELPKAEVKKEPEADAATTQHSTALAQMGWQWDKWRNHRKLTPHKRIHQEYINLPLPEPGTIRFLKSGTGTGKTTRLQMWVEQWRKLDDYYFLSPGYRNSLLRQLAAILKIRHIHEKDIGIMAREPGSGIGFCLHSILKIEPIIPQNPPKIVILDEVMSVVRDLLTSKTIKRRWEVIAKFKEMLQAAEIVICLDATLADWCVEFIGKCTPNKKVEVIENTYKGKKPRLNFLLGTFTEDVSKIRKNDRSPYFKMMLEAPQTSSCSDSQIFLEGVNEIQTTEVKKVLRIDSTTTGNEITKEFLKNSNQAILDYKPQSLLYSPSAESGLDINTEGYFSHHFGFFFGVQGVDAIIQMMGRLRDSGCEKYVWIKEYGSPGEDAVMKSIKELFLDDIETTLSTEESAQLIIEKCKLLLSDSTEGFELRTTILINEMANFEKANLRACTREAFVEAGYEVCDRTLEGSTKHTEQEKEVKEEVKQERSIAIANAEQIPIDGDEDWKQLEELKMSEKLEDRWKLENAFLRKRLPGIEKSDVWGAGLVYRAKFEERDFISHCENYWLLQNPEVAKGLAVRNFAEMAHYERIFLPDYHSKWSLVHALREIGIEKFLSEGAEWHENSPELKELVKASAKHQNALAAKPTSEKGRNIKFLSKLLGKLGLKLKAESRRVGNQRVRFYRLDGTCYSDPFRVAALHSITQKWDGTLVKLEAETAVSSANELLSEKQPQTLMQQGVEGGTLVGNMYTIFESNVPPLEEKSQCVSDGSISAEVTQDDVLTPAEELAELLVEFADSDSVESYEMFYSLIEFSPANVIEAAIVAAPTGWLRQLWWKFYEAIIAPRLAIENF